MFRSLYKSKEREGSGFMSLNVDLQHLSICTNRLINVLVQIFIEKGPTSTMLKFATRYVANSKT
jgi:hypothetical protein